jgi:hypothetical protein
MSKSQLFSALHDRNVEAELSCAPAEKGSDGVYYAGAYYTIRVAWEDENHLVKMIKNSRGHWEIEDRTTFPDWVLDLEADYVRMIKECEAETITS